MFKKIQFILLVPCCLLAIVGNQVAQTKDTRTPEQKMADFRTWDRLDSGQISPEGFRNDKNPDIREKAREVAERNAADRDAQAKSQQQMADFLTWDRLDSGAISPEGLLNANNPAIREKAREMVERRAAANRLAATNNIEALNQKFTLLRQLSARWGFSEMVINGDGRISLSVVNDIKPNTAPYTLGSYAFAARPPNIAGHQYLSLNYLGKDLDLDSVWSIVTDHFAEIFPADRVTGSSGRITEGNQYNLMMSIAGIERSNAVSVIGTTKYTFTLDAGPEHTLRGSVTHGVVRDSDGNVWLFEEGAGVQGEDPRLQDFNYAVADVMWNRMASNIRSRLSR